jgi:hypothetical protein
VYCAFADTFSISIHIHLSIDDFSFIAREKKKNSRTDVKSCYVADATASTITVAP